MKAEEKCSESNSVVMATSDWVQVSGFLHGLTVSDAERETKNPEVFWVVS